jgi:HK97 family phage major capsid protein
MAETIGAPTLDTDVDDADWTSELATGSEDSSLAFGRRSLTPHPLAKRIKISNDLLGGGGINAEQLAIDRLSYKFAISEEKGFMTGTGAAQALGVFTASAQGISTGRDVSTDNTTTEIRFDGLKNAKYSIKGAYWPRLRWVFHRDALKMLSKLKDGEGRYQWEASVQVGQPDRLLNFPLHVSEYAPNTFTTGLYVGILGDFSKYWIVDSLKLRFQRLVELYAETNQIGLIGRAKVDGMPVLEEAFARVKLA